MEDTLSQQTAVVGSAMRFYEHMQLPGMDLLTERWRAYTTAKQVSSAGRQFGLRTRLTETYGCTGWDFPFAGHKALGDWQAALGINLRCQHLAWYTMEAEAKRDYPAAISWQSPWWTGVPEGRGLLRPHQRGHLAGRRGARPARRAPRGEHVADGAPGLAGRPGGEALRPAADRARGHAARRARGFRLRRRGDPLAQGRRGEGERRARLQSRQGRLHRGARAAGDHAALDHPRAAGAVRRRWRARGVRGRSRGARRRRAVRPGRGTRRPRGPRSRLRARSWSRRSSPPGASPSPIPRATRSPRRCTC